jgi:hypothetical protein
MKAHSQSQFRWFEINGLPKSINRGGWYKPITIWNLGNAAINLQDPCRPRFDKRGWKSILLQGRGTGGIIEFNKLTAPFLELDLAVVVWLPETKQKRPTLWSTFG